MNYIKWGFESRLKPNVRSRTQRDNYIKWGFESRLKQSVFVNIPLHIISNGDLRVD